MKVTYYTAIPIIINFCFEIGFVIAIIKKIYYKILKSISINSSLKENINRTLIPIEFKGIKTKVFFAFKNSPMIPRADGIIGLKLFTYN